jgi:hypothetical protein
MKDYKFEIGESVVVENDGANYSTYCDWFRENEVRELLGYYQYRGDLGEGKEAGTEYTVVARGPHHAQSRGLYAIQDRNDRVWLISERGLESKKEKTSRLEVIAIVKELVEKYGGANIQKALSSLV